MLIANKPHPRYRMRQSIRRQERPLFVFNIPCPSFKIRLAVLSKEHFLSTFWNELVSIQPFTSPWLWFRMERLQYLSLSFQITVQTVLVVVALASVPVMLLGTPLHLWSQHRLRSFPNAVRVLHSWACWPNIASSSNYFVKSISAAL